MGTRKSFDEPGHAHELTFTVYRRTPIFEDPRFCEAFLARLDATRTRHAFELWAYVVMPEHVHLLVWPTVEVYSVAAVLKALKQPFAAEAFRSGMLSPELEARLRDQKGHRILWQPGGGYDRNLWSRRALAAAVDYLHNNPVRRGLAQRAVDYRWSSASWYEGLGGPVRVDPLRE